MNDQSRSHAVMAQRVKAADSLNFFPTPPWATRALLKTIIYPMATFEGRDAMMSGQCPHEDVAFRWPTAAIQVSVTDGETVALWYDDVANQSISEVDIAADDVDFIVAALNKAKAHIECARRQRDGADQ